MVDDILNSEEVIEEEESKQIPNIIIAGATGAGKSTLINAVFGEELANTATGKPVTDKMNEYKNDYICIWDTAGLEIDRKRTEKTIQEIKDKIVEKASKSKTDVIHAIWYCINAQSKRYQPEELKIIKRLHKDQNVPFFIILTQSYNEEEESNPLEKYIREENEKYGLDDIEIIQVVAKDYKFQTIIVKQKGLNELVDKTSSRLEEYIKEGFIAAQQIDKEAKRNLAIEKLSFACNEFEKNFWGKIWGINIFVTDENVIKTLKELSNIYQTKFTDKQIKNIIEKNGLKTDSLLKQAWDDFINSKTFKDNQNEIQGYLEKIIISMIFPKYFKQKESLENIIKIIVKSTGKVIVDGIHQTKSLAIQSNLEWFLNPFSKEDHMKNIKKYMKNEIDTDLLKSSSVEKLSNDYNNRFETMYIFSIGITFINAIEDFWMNDYTKDEITKIDKVSKNFGEKLKELKNRLNKNKKSEDETFEDDDWD